MTKLKIGDFTKVITGYDNKKKGHILAIFKKINKCIVKGINIRKRYIKKTPGKIIKKEGLIDLSNILFYSKNNYSTKLGFYFDENGKKIRFEKKKEYYD